MPRCTTRRNRAESDPAVLLSSKEELCRQPRSSRWAQPRVASSRPRSRNTEREAANWREELQLVCSLPHTLLRSCKVVTSNGWLFCLIALLHVVALPRLAEAGKCVQPPKGGTAFCQIDYQVYVSTDTANNDTDYWFDLDNRAETLTEQWAENMGCDPSVLDGQSWCKNYACALNFPKCTAFKDAPLPVCRQSCVDCYRTCTPDRPILPPGIYYPPGIGEERTWEAQYDQIVYDAWSKSYICEADHKLVDGGKFLFFTIGTACTGAASNQHCSWAGIAILSVGALVVQLRH